MTEFRKHKNGKAFPITPRKAYGESRAPAEEVVQELRKKGMRARLIKTNRKKDLYAPYKGVLPVEEKDMPRDKDYTPVQGNTEMKELSSTKLNEMDDYAETIRSKHGISGGVFDPKKVMFVVKTPEQEEIVQSIIDEINKKYGVNYSFSETRPGGYMWYKRVPDNDKTVRIATKKSGITKTSPPADKVKVKFDMEGNRKRGGVYAAVITGTDPKYGLKREWLKGDTTSVNNHYINKHFNTELPKGTIVELGSEGSGEFYIVDPKAPDGDGLRPLNLSNKGQDLLKMKQHFRKKEEQ